jgi:WD40 repeat protein
MMLMGIAVTTLTTMIETTAQPILRDTVTVAWHPNMDILAVRDEQSVRIIDVQSGQLLDTLRAEGWSPSASTHWSPDGTMLAFSSGIDVEIWETVWDAQKATLKSVYQSYIDDDPSVPRLGTGNLAWHPNSQ